MMVAPSIPFSEPDDMLATLQKMSGDPAMQYELDHLQRQVLQSIEAIIAKLSARLRAEALAGTPELTTGLDLAEAGARARRQTAIARECQALAQDMVFASLLHLGDPAWNPLMSSAPPALPGSLLATLLERD